MGSAPLVFVFDTVANVRNTVLLDMRLTAGVADMTGVSTVRFENVSLADVTLVQGDVISTGLYHYEALEYNPDNDPPEDDAGMDAETEVSLEWVPPEHRSIFGEQYIISEAILTRCVEWKVDRPPWCQGEHTQRRGLLPASMSVAMRKSTMLMMHAPVDRSVRGPRLLHFSSPKSITGFLRSGSARTGINHRIQVEPFIPYTVHAFRATWRKQRRPGIATNDTNHDTNRSTNQP